MNTAEASNSDVDDERGPCQARPGSRQMPNPTPARSDAFATPSQRFAPPAPRRGSHPQLGSAWECRCRHKARRRRR